MSAKRILIVEDQRSLARMLRSGIESLEAEVSVLDVPSGEEAMLLATSEPIDLLVSDIMLAGMDGFELMARFQEENPNLKIILISGVTDPQIRQRIAQSGADAFLFKPIELADFLDTVERTLGLVETILPPEPVIEDEELAAQSLAERLAMLRQELDISGAILLDERGRFLIKAGSSPDPDFEINLMPALVEALNAGTHISEQIGAKMPDNLLSFKGDQYELLLAHIGEAYGLLMLSEDKPILQIRQAPEAIRSAIYDLATTLTQLGIPLSSPEIEPVVEPEPIEVVTESAPIVEESPELADLLSNISRTHLKPEEVDAFWESVVDQDPHE
jgi:CheY-like chemotaxis protein